MAVYALCFVAIKAGLAFAPPLLFAGLRAEIAGLTLLGIAAASRRIAVPPPAGWPGILALALTSTTLAFGAMFLSPGRTGAGIASVLGNLQPLVVLVAATVFLGEALTLTKVVALGVGLAGVTLVALPAVAGPDAYGFSGPLLAIGASASLGAGNVILKKIVTRHDLLAITGWQLALGGLPLLVSSALVEREASATWSVPFVLLLLGLALGGTAAPTLVWNHLARSEEIGRLTLSLLLVPVFGVGFAALAFGERLGPAELAGGIAVLAALGIATRPANAPPRL